MTARVLPHAPTLRHRGCTYRITARGIELRATSRGEPPGEWASATVQQLRNMHAPDSPVWTWLREHGYVRPSPSGASGAHVKRRVPAQLSTATVEAADTLAARWGCTRGQAIERAVVEAAGRQNENPRPAR